MATRIGVSASVWRAVGISLCAVLVIAAVAFDVLGPKTNTTPTRVASVSVSPAPQLGAVIDPPASATPTPSASAPPTQTATPTPTPTPTSTPAPTSTPTPTPAQNAPGGTEPPGGPGVTEPGIDVRLSPRVDGSFDVVEHLVMRTPATSIVLVPPDPTVAGVTFTGSTPSVSGVQADSGGQPIYDLPSGRVEGRTLLTLGVTTTSVNLRYRLDGTSILSTPSSTGRALAFVRPITAGIDPTLPIQVHASGSGVLNLTCPELPADQLGCARGSVPALFVKGLTASKSTVVVQFNIPEP